MMGVIEPTVLEDPVVRMEDIFRDLHPEGQQAASLDAADKEEVRPETAMVEEVIVDRGQEG